MKRENVIYWVTTAIVSAAMLASACYFGFDPKAKGAFAHLGLPDYFRLELTFAKTVGALALLIPLIPNRLKEFAYAGFAITLISAVIAHSSSGDGLASLDPLIFFALLSVSYVYHHKRMARAARGHLPRSTISATTSGARLDHPLTNA